VEEGILPGPKRPRLSGEEKCRCLSDTIRTIKDALKSREALRTNQDGGIDSQSLDTAKSLGAILSKVKFLS
jgi:hypothetical protein